jgi:hypothetical protein
MLEFVSVRSGGPGHSWARLAYLGRTHAIFAGAAPGGLSARQMMRLGVRMAMRVLAGPTGHQIAQNT